MAAFVSQLPEAGEDEALGEGVGCPGQDLKVGVREVGGDLGGDEGEGEDEEEVSEYICQRDEGIGVKAMGRDGRVDLFHGVLWWVECRRSGYVWDYFHLVPRDCFFFHNYRLRLSIIREWL